MSCSQIPDRNNSPQSLLMAADRALYKAKQQGRNRYETVISHRNFKDKSNCLLINDKYTCTLL